MNNKLSSKFTLLVIAIVFATATQSQTAGTLTVVYTPTVPSTATFYSGNRHLGAAWIQTSANAFVKTKIKYCGGNCDHLTSSPWQTSSAGSTVGADVASGATKTTFTAITFTWNGTNTAGTLMPDGSYNIKIFEVWNHGSTTNQQYTSTIAFTKGTTASTITPAATNWLKNVSIIWTPAFTTSLEENIHSNPIVNVSPNPTEGIFNVDFKNANCIKVISTLGIVVHEIKLDVLSDGSEKIDLTHFTNGVYFINIANNKGAINHKVIVNK